MRTFNLLRYSELNRDTIFSISTNVSQFHKIMPNYFKSLEIIDVENSEQIVLEKISFLGQTLDVKTKHVVLPPNIHKVLILSGPLQGTSFIEYYEISQNGTEIKICISLQVNGFLKLVPFLDRILAKKMNKVMSEFISCSENYAGSNSVSH
jgi:hypothetical protein